MNQDFTTSFLVDQGPQKVFAAINDVRSWWSGDVEGSTNKLGDEFTYRYEDVHYSKQRIAEFIPDKKIVWLVLDGRLNFVADKREWTGTRIMFDIVTRGDQTEVAFTHVGLVPENQCFTACSSAWSYYINGSLRRLIAGGA